MRIFVKTGQELKRQVTKDIAPLSARHELEDNIERERNNTKNSSIQDRNQAVRELKKWQNTLEKNNPENLSVETKNFMWRKAKQLKDEFTVGMLSRDELHPVRTIVIGNVVSVVVDNEKMESVNSVKRQIEWDKRMGKKVSEYKNIMRHLCPDNPAATDVEKFRPTKKTG